MALWKTGLPLDGRAALKAYRKLSALIDASGARSLRCLPTLLPRRDFRPIGFDGTTESIMRLVDKVRGVMGIPEDEVRTYLVGEDGAIGVDAKRAPFEGSYESRDMAACYCRQGVTEAGSEEPDGHPAIIVFLESFSIRAAESLVATLAHEFSHHIIASMPGIDAGDEELADLLPLLYGFGVFTANASQEYATDGWIDGAMAYHSWTTHKLGYLPQPLLAFALAAVCAWKREDRRPIRGELSPNPQDTFDKSRRFLASNKYIPWDGVASGALLRRLEDEAASEQEWEDVQAGPALRRADVTWSGTFISGSPIVSRVDGVAYVQANHLDFGISAETLPWVAGTCFGFAYRLVSERAGEPFEIVESLRLEGVEPGGPSVSFARTVLSDELQRFAAVVGLDPIEAPCRAVLEILHDGEPVASRGFDVGIIKAKKSLAQKALDLIF